MGEQASLPSDATSATRRVSSEGAGSLLDNVLWPTSIGHAHRQTPMSDDPEPHERKPIPPGRSLRARPTPGVAARTMSAGLGVVVLAGEHSEAMVSDVPPALHRLAGTPAAQYVIDAARRLDPATVVVVGDERAQGREALTGADAFLAGPRELFGSLGECEATLFVWGRHAPAGPLRHAGRREAARGDAGAARLPDQRGRGRRGRVRGDRLARGAGPARELHRVAGRAGAIGQEPRGHGRGGRRGEPAAREPPGAGAGGRARAGTAHHPPPAGGRDLPRPVVGLRGPRRAAGGGRGGRAELLPVRGDVGGGGAR